MVTLVVMEFVLAVFGFGALLLLAGLVGGDLTFQGATIPRIGRLPRFTLTIVGGVLIAASGLLWTTIVLPDEPVGPSAPPRTGQFTATVTRDLAPAHREEAVDLFVDQAPVGSLTVDADEPRGSLEITLPDEPVGYEVVMHARDHSNHELVFSGTGTLEPAPVFRVLLQPSSAGVELRPEPD